MKPTTIATLLLYFISLTISAQPKIVPITGAAVPAAATAVHNQTATTYPTGLSPTFVRTWTVQKPLTDPWAVVSSQGIQEVHLTTEYLDGLGKPLQTVSRAITPLGHDLVTPVVYDGFYRNVYQYLPYAATSVDGSFKLSPFADQHTFMQSHHPGEQVFYSQTDYEASGLNRVTNSYAPGNSWAGSARGLQHKYLLNTLADDVLVWAVAFDPFAYDHTDNNKNIPFTLSASTYEPGQLYKNVTIDEQGKAVVEYKDMEGKMVLKKVQVDNTVAPDYTGHNGFLCTYYVYDDLGQLRFVMPPKAVEAIQGDWSPANHPDAVHQLCFRYAYDARGRMIAKKVPGAGWAYMIYDDRDRLVMTQDAAMRSQDNYLYTEYDHLNRPVATGLLHDPAGSAALHQSQAYSSTTYPAISSWNSTELTRTYYDSYGWSGSPFGSAMDQSQVGSGGFSAASDVAFPYPQQVASVSNVTGLVTGTKVKVLDDSHPAQYLYSTTYYDDRYRPVQQQSTHLDGTETVTNQYSYDGKLLRSKVHSNGSTSYTLLTTNTYDGAGRLLSTTKNVSSPGVSSTGDKVIVQHSYDEQGQLLKKDLGTDPVSAAALESLHYAYNIRGWLTGINKGYATAQSTAGRFGMHLSYDYGFDLASGNSGYYNGNIAGALWKSAGDGEQRAYGFAYDAAGRLMKADFTQNNGGWNTSAGVDFSMMMGDGSTHGTAYDANGNILAMQQWGLQVSGSSPIDDLHYEYFSGGNKLARVSDGVAAPAHGSAMLGDFVDKNDAGNDYGYDHNGNMVTDLNKRMGSAAATGEDVVAGSGQAITYNHLNLPQLVAVNDDNGNPGKGAIEYIYDATGGKLRKVVTENGHASNNNTTIITTTTYRGGAVYQTRQVNGVGSSGTELQFIAHEEGRIRPQTDASGAITGYAYDYFVKDHLGNTRMVLTEEQQLEQYGAVSFEQGSLSAEQAKYEQVDVSRVAQQDFPSPNGDNTAQLLSRTTHSVGVGKLLRVMAEDRLHVTVDYYVPGETVDNNSANGINSLVASLATLLSAASAPAAVKGSAGVITGALGSSGSAAGAFLYPQSGGVASSMPKAYLNILFFDEQFRFVSQGSESIQVSVTGAVSQLQRLAATAKAAPRNGYVYIYVSNESNNNVYFDNFNVTHERGPLLEETHYYPFGLTMAGISSKAAGKLENKKGFNGNELQTKEFSDGSGLELYDFDARTYDQQIGRFIQIDPLLEEDGQESINPYHFSYNNPIRFNDPDGKAAYDIVIRGENNSSVTIETDLVDIDVNASSLGVDFGGTYTFQGDDILGAALDIVGIFDPTGIADGIAAKLSVDKGDWGGAIISGLGILPYVGDIGKVGKVGKDVKIIKNAVENISNGRKQVTKVLPTRKAALDARPKPKPAKKGEKQVTRQSRNKSGEGKKFKTDGGSQTPHVHDRNHKNKKKPNIHYRIGKKKIKP